MRKTGECIPFADMTGVEPARSIDAGAHIKSAVPDLSYMPAKKTVIICFYFRCNSIFFEKNA